MSQGHEIIADEELAKTAIYDRWLKPNGFFHRLCGVVRRCDDRVLFLVASRPSASGRYDNQETRYLNDLLPHLQRAINLNRKLGKAGAMASAFEHLPCAVFIVDGSGRPVLANLAAEALLIHSHLQLDGEGRLSASTAAATAQLHSAFAGLAAADPAAPWHLLTPARPGGHPAQFLLLAPIGPRAREVYPGTGAVLVLAAPQRPLEWLPGTFQECYGLTPAEERLAFLILQGFRLDEAEAVLGIRHSTARTHMRRIYAKTGTRRQAELVRVMMSAQSSFVLPTAEEKEMD